MVIDRNQVELFVSLTPILNGTLENDAHELAQFVKKAELLLVKLPEKFARTHDEQNLAQQIMTACRKIRTQLLARHADEVYSFLSSDSHSYRSLSDLIFLAAEKFPFLVPTRAQIESEQKKIQEHKEGYEIDQGIFFRGILRSPKAGSHLVDAMLLPSTRALSLLEVFTAEGQIDLGSVFLQRSGEAAYLTINNQHCLNAEDNNLINDLQVAVDLVLLEERVKVGVLRGGVMHHPRYKGKRVFCSGINLAELQAGKISFVDFLLGREFGYINKIRHGIINQDEHETIQKPWVAVVDSHSIGGGMQMLLVVDKVIAAENVYFSLPAAQEGIVPGAANLRLPHMAGYRLARQMILSGKKIYASDPEARWLCDHTVPTEEIDVAIQAAVEELKNPAVVLNRKMLNLAEEPRERFREYMAEFSYIQAMRLYSDDVLEKISRWAKKEKTSC